MYRTATQIEAAMNLLTAWFPQYCTRISLPETSVQGRDIHALRVRAGDGDDRRGVLMLGGTHARELMNPDALIDLAVDLVVSHSGSSDIVYGGRTWTASEVKTILETMDIWMIPLVNPDGREQVLNVDDMWRKNLRNTGCSPSENGVDLNRNLDILWGVTQGSISCNPCVDNYCGPGAFSEPETRNVKFLLDTRRIDCFVDVHSYSELVLYPWGHAPTQTTNPAQNFTTLPTGTCSPIGVPGYEEYMPARDLERYETVSTKIAEAIKDVNGNTYTPQPSLGLYATTGTFDDYVYSRHLSNPELRKTYGFTFETGGWKGSYPESFHPANPDPTKTEAKSGLLSLAQQCICAIELIGNSFFDNDDELRSLRRVRDEMLATTDAGRDWIGVFERSQGALIAGVVEDRELMSEAATLVKRIAAVVDGEEVTGEDLERADRLLGQISEYAGRDGVRKELELVRERAREFEGARGEEIIGRLMERPPREGDAAN